MDEPGKPGGRMEWGGGGGTIGHSIVIGSTYIRSKPTNNTGYSPHSSTYYRLIC
jgi:hypothetical protein